MIINTLPDKSGNPDSLKKYLPQFESFSTNVAIADEDWLRAFNTRCFIYSFAIKVISEKTV